MKDYSEIVGKTFGRLHIDSISHIDERHRLYVNCTCSCGNKKVIAFSPIKLGRTVSCGCFMRENNGNRSRTHGKCKDPIYKAYIQMKGRCYNPNNLSYNHYGGRGIKICDEWLNNFDAFYDWSIANGFSNQKSPKGRRLLSIDRIDVNGNYEPSNCRWTTNEIQGQNTTKNKHYTYNGETHLIKEWAKILGIKEPTLYARLHSWSIEDAFTRRVIIKNRKKEN